MMNYTVTRSRRKSIALGIGDDLTVYVKAPLGCPDKTIAEFVEAKADWINEHIERLRAEKEAADREGHLSYEELRRLAGEAADYLPERVSFFARRLGVSFGRITIRNQTTRWGSCSSEGNLNFNCLLMLMPTEMSDYIVVHELCHRLEMNHSPRFYALIESVLPDYREREKWIKENGGRILRRMKG